VEKACRAYPLTDVRRKLPRSFNDPLSVVAWHLSLAVAWRRGFDRLFDVHQAIVDRFPRFVFYAQQDGEAEPDERTAPLQPIRRIEQFDRRIITPGTKKDGQPAHFLALEHVRYFAPL